MALGLQAALRARDSSPERLAAVVTAGQLLVVRESLRSVPEMLDEQGIQSDPMVDLLPGLFVGRASDGRTLTGLLEQAKTDYQFNMIVRTQLQDVGRTAEAVARTVEPNVTHYVRILSLPSCGRCVILAGRPSKSEEAFDRHPQCDCTTQPTNAANAPKYVTDPAAAFEQMTKAEQDKAFTTAGAEAVRLGADMSQVVNARAGMSTAQIATRGVGDRWTASGRLTRVDVFGQQLATTTEGTTKRGLARKAMTERATTSAKTVRLMPESILKIADNKAEAVRLLKLYGYVL